MDPAVAQAIVVGITTSVGTLGIAGLLFKGDKVVLAREKAEALAARDAIIALKDETISQLKDANKEVNERLRIADDTVHDLSRQTFEAIKSLERVSDSVVQGIRKS